MWNEIKPGDEYASRTDTHVLDTMHFSYYYGGGILRRFGTNGSYQEVTANKMPEPDSHKLAVIFGQAKLLGKLAVNQQA